MGGRLFKASFFIFLRRGVGRVNKIGGRLK